MYFRGGHLPSFTFRHFMVMEKNGFLSETVYFYRCCFAVVRHIKKKKKNEEIIVFGKKKEN